MSDLLTQLNNNPLTGWLAKMMGLPNPVVLDREEDGYAARPFIARKALLAGSGYAMADLRKALVGGGADLDVSAADGKLNIVVVDATNCVTPADYRVLYDNFHPHMRRIAVNGRVLIAAPLIEEAADPVAAAVARGIEGFSRSLGKELGKNGVTVNLAYVSRHATDRLDGVVRFFCGKQTAYVSGQTVTVTNAVSQPATVPVTRVLDGKVALVTGSARGIGLATAQRLVQDGARVVCLDVPAMADELNRVCMEMGATPLALDITGTDAPRLLADFLSEKFGGVDVVIHNAGITRDKTLANMTESFWDLVVNINLAAVIAIDKVLIGEQVLRDGGRVVCLSSISGVAGNFGQTNYAATKAALMGYVAAQAPGLAARGICINAIAPGFIETAMTAAMPFATREIGRRLNSIKQGGQPRDAAELIAFLSSPGVCGVTGNTIRVCGQGLVGA